VVSMGIRGLCLSKCPWTTSLKNNGNQNSEWVAYKLESLGMHCEAPQNSTFMNQYELYFKKFWRPLQTCWWYLLYKKRKETVVLWMSPSKLIVKFNPHCEDLRGWNLTGLWYLKVVSLGGKIKWGCKSGSLMKCNYCFTERGGSWMRICCNAM
jgi:hypothetical protein